MEDRTAESCGFSIKDCALIAIATGRRIHTLNELRESLRTIDLDSIYYHFWGSLLQPRFEEREFNNDFASWVRHGLHDEVLAERVAVIDPTDYPDMEQLRHELIELVEIRLEEREYLYWVRSTESFEFIRSQIVVFDTHKCARTPEELARMFPAITTSSVFYHFIDARRRSGEGEDDFRSWVKSFGDEYVPLCEALHGIDPYFASLTDVRAQLAQVFADHLNESLRP